jgi:hypothetical protein
VSTDTATARSLEQARAIADAVLYEGYVLYPYHAAATKNRYRWQFGVVVPERQLATGDAESSMLRSQVLVAASPGTSIEVVLRFLHPRRRQVERLDEDGRLVAVDQLEVGGELQTTWEEGVEHEHRLGCYPLDTLLEHPASVDVHLDASEEIEELYERDGTRVGRLVRATEAVDLRVELRGERVASDVDTDVVRATTEVVNVTDWADAAAERAEVVRHGVAGLHLLLVAHEGRFASAIDPPTWASASASACHNLGTYPVLVGDQDGDPSAPHSRGDDVVLSAPIILYDHPQVADESPGDAYDATEIHELLTLCTTALTDAEKRAARATDPRAAAVIDDADHLPPEILARLHGAVRELGPTDAGPSADLGGRPTHRDAGPAADLDGTRLNEPGAAQTLEAELAEFLGVGDDPIGSAQLGHTRITLGDRVRLEPGRRADAQDVFVAGRIGVVGKIVETLEGEVQVGVTIEDDPAAEFHEWYGRFLYFHLDELAVPDDDREGEAT